MVAGTSAGEDARTTSGLETVPAFRAIQNHTVTKPAATKSSRGDEIASEDL
jgi:transketolase